MVEDAYVLVHDKKISAASDLVPVLEKMVQGGRRNLFIDSEYV